MSGLAGAEPANSSKVGRAGEIGLSLAKPYGYQWRTRTRPRILERDGHRCRRCGAGGRLDVAHLDQNPANDTDDNLAALCRLDHRRHDYHAWREKSHETRAARKDRARPLLAIGAIKL